MFIVHLLCSLYISDTGENVIAVKELAKSANVTAVNGLTHSGDFSEKLLNTSSALSKVNETWQKTNEIIINSSKAGRLLASLLSGNVTVCKTRVNF